ncbi:hypothetical protein CPLU01_12910 [Colletotrichum plurivorum]|uniref:ATP-dependent DNA helicase n=1 Tax=Colletotrichum plurivorum TaxID=2175906 RepID=A0A8H6JVR9_9PEZI|nr:hypothetical protein CPLU01_12910 [Colletotrichum plurivorum]
MDLDMGHRISFHQTVATTLNLNQRQIFALQIVCHKLDKHRANSSGTKPLLLFVSGEGGPGKSWVVAALSAVFAVLNQGHRLLVTATSGTAAANINGITIHSACHLFQNKIQRRQAPTDGFGGTGCRLDGEIKAEWRERGLLVIDEISVLGAATLFAFNTGLHHFRDSDDDFGGMPIVMFCGDFHQFRPVTEGSIVLPSTPRMTLQNRYEHDQAHALWLRFTTVILLEEQVRAAGDVRLQQLLHRI